MASAARFCVGWDSIRLKKSTDSTIISCIPVVGL
jgi:hypothetical protein